MALYKIQGTVVKKIQTKELDLEKSLQEIMESNLEEILNITFLAHEYATSFGGRIDTLGIDKNGSPCIIEYKKNQNDNVINQGLSYLRWLVDHRADFQILVEKKMSNMVVDWDSPRVICIAENFNRFDLDTADILPINIELYRHRLYEDNLLFLEADEYQKGESASPTLKKITKHKDQSIQKTYVLDDHLKNADDITKQLFYALREKILSIDEEIKEEPKKLYIAYKASTNFVDLSIFTGRSHGIKVFINVKSGQLKDPTGIARDLSKPKPIGHWGNGDYEVKITKEDEIDDTFYLIKQSYNFNK